MAVAVTVAAGVPPMAGAGQRQAVADTRAVARRVGERPRAVARPPARVMRPAGRTGAAGAARGSGGAGTVSTGNNASAGAVHADESRGSPGVNSGAAAAVSQNPNVAREANGTGNGTVRTQTGNSVANGNRAGAAEAHQGRGRFGDRHNGYNPYVPNQYRSNGSNYGAVYGYPFYPFSYGFNSGWYGNGYGDNYNSYPYYGYSFATA